LNKLEVDKTSSENTEEKAGDGNMAAAVPGPARINPTFRTSYSRLNHEPN
jgi:hypothetical protein